MARKDAKRVVITRRSTEGMGSTYTPTKCRQNRRARLELRTYDPKLRPMAISRETR